VVDTVRINIAGSEYQINRDVVEHILQRHSREFWEGSVKAEQSFLPAGFGADELVDVIRDVLRKNEAEVARIGAGYGALPLTQSHGLTWQLGLNGGHVGQLYPRF